MSRLILVLEFTDRSVLASMATDPEFIVALVVAMVAVLAWEKRWGMN